jgi:plastocyanin/heme-degrading monooxygenase HmoA
LDYVQQVSATIQPAKLADVQALIDDLEAHHGAIRRAPGLVSAQITRGEEPDGDTTVTFESRWRSGAALADYAAGAEHAEAVFTRHGAIVELDTLRIRRMEALDAPATGRSGVVYERFALAAMVPLVIVGVGLAVIYGMSRIFLQNHGDAAVFIAAFVSVMILGAAALLAANPNLPRWALASGGSAVIAALIAGAVYAENKDGPEIGGHAEASPTPTDEFFVEMGDNFFEPTDITIPPGQDVVLELRNTGNAIHNMHVAVDGDYAETICEAGGDAPCSDPDQVRGGQTATITLNLAPGEYDFRCDFHPDEMTGTLTVEEGAPVPGAPPPGGPGDEPGPGGPDGGPPPFDMEDNEFPQDELRAPADTDVSIPVVNSGRAIHNVHVALDGDYDSAVCETGDEEPCTDPDQIRGGQDGTLTFNLPAGEYDFRCDFHPEEMTGTLLVE